MECEKEIKARDKFIYRRKLIVVDGDKIIDLSPVCKECADKDRG